MFDSECENNGNELAELLDYVDLALIGEYLGNLFLGYHSFRWVVSNYWLMVDGGNCFVAPDNIKQL
jgi:hypothetical protein